MAEDANLEENEDSSSSEDGQIVENQDFDNEHFDPDSDNVIETVDEAGGIDLTTGGARQTEKAEATPKEEPPEKEPLDEEKKPEPYHKDPAWQRIIKERDEAVAALNKKPVESSKVDDFNNLTDTEISELQNDDPKAFISSLRDSIKESVRNELITELNAKENEANIDKTYDAYSKENSDNDDGTGFVQMWDSGATQKFIDQNPGHTPISAHMAMTIESKIKAQVETAVKTAKEEMTKQQRARVVTDGLGIGPGHAPKEGKELNETKQKGGLVTVLADRLRRTRQAI